MPWRNQETHLEGVQKYGITAWSISLAPLVIRPECYAGGFVQDEWRLRQFPQHSLLPDFGGSQLRLMGCHCTGHADLDCQPRNQASITGLRAQVQPSMHELKKHGRSSHGVPSQAAQPGQAGLCQLNALLADPEGEGYARQP